MTAFKMTSWNAEWLEHTAGVDLGWYAPGERVFPKTTPSKKVAKARIEGLKTVVAEVDPDILFLCEGVKGAEHMQAFVTKHLPAYDLVVHRGIRFELHQESVTLVGGEERVVEVDLAPAYAHDGWVLGDPHSHASPSQDGGITMEERLLVQAGTGVQVHFGTDHDHLADYRPLVDVTGLEHVRVGDEVVLLGRYGDASISAHDIATWANVSTYEVFCGISKRVPRS